MVEDNTKEIMAQMDPGLRAALERLHTTIQQSPIQKEALKFKKTVAEKSFQPEQQLFSFMPHQMAKTSIFFPMSDKELKEENRLIQRLEHETRWGKVTIEGIKLAIFEEDIFLALLTLAKTQTQKDGNSYTLNTTMPEIAKILYGKNGYTKRAYEVISRALHHFELIRFEILVWDWKKKGRERIKVEKEVSIAGLLSGHTYNHKTQELIISFNPYFFAYFLESMLTGINLTLRRKLKKDGSKTLLRFLSTHREPKRMDFLIVLEALNFNTKQPKYELRRKLKYFISELKKHNILGPKTRIFPDDTVYFDILKKRKQLP